MHSHHLVTVESRQGRSNGTRFTFSRTLCILLNKLIALFSLYPIAESDISAAGLWSLQ